MEPRRDAGVRHQLGLSYKNLYGYNGAMQNLVPTLRPALDFEPVPRKYRYDGWTAERQRAFIAALADTGSVTHAARRINMSTEGAYYLRRQPGAESFAAAWNAALEHGVQCLADIAIARAIEGVPVPIHWRGEQIGEKRRYNDRLLMFVLRHHLADRYGGPGIGRGTRSRQTIEREAAENCPVCKARAAEAEAEASAEQQQANAAANAALLDRYRAKVRGERKARLEGRIVAADFAVRQLTQIELSLALCGESDACRAVWEELADRALDAGSPHQPEDAAVAICRMLDHVRREVWKEDGLSRPPTDPTDGGASTALAGDDIPARRAAQEEACRRMAQAQALWEAASTEERWRAWRGAADGGRAGG